MVAAKKQPLYLIVDRSYDEVREVSGALKNVETELQSISEEREYSSEELRTFVKVYEVAAQLKVEAEESLRVYVTP